MQFSMWAMQTHSLVQRLDKLIEAYLKHLQNVAGLAPSTCVDRIYHVRQFLEAQFKASTQTVDLERLSPQSVLAHVLDQSRRYPPATLQKVGSALRSFLRFLCLSQGRQSDLSSAVPRIGVGPSPQFLDYLTEKELAQLLGSFDEDTAMGLRDRAVVLCLAELGLRAGEVARLKLEDVDWQAGTIHLNRTKGRRERLLPLPQAVGESLAAYLQKGRPKSLTRFVFISDRGGASLSSNAVSKLTQAAMRRAGLGGRRRGAHLLRHTIATHLVQAGGSLKEVADLLGHRSLNTAQAYAKVNGLQLKAVALPWPEVTR